VLAGGPAGVPAGGPAGVPAGGPAGVPLGAPEPVDPSEEPDVVGTVEGRDTLAQKSLMVLYPLARASAVSCGKLSWALLELLLVLVPLFAAAQAVHCP